MVLSGEILNKTGAPLRTALGEKQVNCPTHGVYTTTGAVYMGRREIWTSCPACEEERLAAERHAEAQAKASAQRKHIESMIEDSAIPARFIGRSFDNFCAANTDQISALKIAQDYAENFARHYKNGTGLILSGQPGTGKSHLAAAVLQAIMPAQAGLYITCLGLIRAIRSTWRKDSEKSEGQVLETLCSVPLLVIDEVGVQYGTDGEQTILFDVLDKRYRDMMPTLLLTNQNTDGFKTFVGERTYDRLIQTSKWVQFDWESYRPTARREAV